MKTLLALLLTFALTTAAEAFGLTQREVVYVYEPRSVPAEPLFALSLFGHNLLVGDDYDADSFDVDERRYYYRHYYPRYYRVRIIERRRIIRDRRWRRY